jgi:hypothetical protein
MGAPRLLFTFEQHLDVEQRSAGRLIVGLDRKDVSEVLALVVGDSSTEDATVPYFGLERW